MMYACTSPSLEKTTLIYAFRFTRMIATLKYKCPGGGGGEGGREAYYSKSHFGEISNLHHLVDM